jgi:hypothetical protein
MNPASVNDSARAMMAEIRKWYDVVGNFTPVQQGGGAGQGTNKIYIGWDSTGKLKAQVDTTDLGVIWTGAAPASSQVTVGYQTLPSGVIVQWGSSVVTLSGTSGTVTFPLAFPTSVFTVVPSNGDTATSGGIPGVTTPSTTGFIFGVPGAAGGSYRVNWIAFGK